MKGSTLFQPGLVVAVVATLSATCLYLFLLPSGDYGGHSHYIIESKRSSTAPSKYIQLDAIDVEFVPLVRAVMDAFDNPDDHSGATVENGTLSYEILEDRSKHRVTDTNDFLLDRLLTEFGPPMDLPLHFSYIGEKDAEVFYYSWSVIVIDEYG
jgi:hypothetical protein